jgi:hypothetical protein
MRIPTSLIVMSLLTAVPFGLAIRDTVTGKQRLSADDDDLAYDARREQEWLERHERELAREAEARERSREQLHAKLDQVYGARAHMGSLLRGIELGPASSFLAIDAMLRKADRIITRDSLQVEIDYMGTEVTDVIVDVGDDDDTCAALGSKLMAAWGPSTAGAWLDPASHTRAHFDRDLCKLTFQRYVEPADWVAGVPLEMLGQPVKKLLAAVPHAIHEGNMVEWFLPGVGYGGSSTDMVAYLDQQGRVSSIHASTGTDFDSLVAIRNALTTQLKVQPVRDEELDGWTWKSRKLPVSIQQSPEGRFTLQVGRSWD